MTIILPIYQYAALEIYLLSNICIQVIKALGNSCKSLSPSMKATVSL